MDLRPEQEPLLLEMIHQVYFKYMNYYLIYFIVSFIIIIIFFFYNFLIRPLFGITQLDCQKCVRKIMLP
jgi:hypothetical protein